MIANWLHISIVHLAVIGIPLVTFRIFTLRNEPLDSKSWRNSFLVIIGLAVITGIAYSTGPETVEHTKQVVGAYSQDQVEWHALWGRIVLILQVIAGLLGVMGLASILQEETPDRRIYLILLILSVTNSFIVLYTAHLGGFIRRADLL